MSHEHADTTMWDVGDWENDPELWGSEKDGDGMPYAEVLDRRELARLGFEVWRLTHGDCTYDGDAAPDPVFLTVPQPPTPESSAVPTPWGGQWIRVNGVWQLKQS